MQSLTSYDRDLITQLTTYNFDLSTVAYERYITHQQLDWWSRQPHIAEAIAQARAATSTNTKKPPQPAGAPTSSLSHFVTSSLPLRTHPAREHVEEFNHVRILGEDAMFVEVDAVKSTSLKVCDKPLCTALVTNRPRL